MPRHPLITLMLLAATSRLSDYPTNSIKDIPDPGKLDSPDPAEPKIVGIDLAPPGTHDFSVKSAVVATDDASRRMEHRVQIIREPAHWEPAHFERLTTRHDHERIAEAQARRDRKAAKRAEQIARSLAGNYHRTVQ